MSVGKSLFNSVVLAIEQKLNNGELKEGDKLPSERELSQIYQISRHGVRQALTVLQGKGLIEITPGKGAYITSYNEDILTESFKRIARKYDSSMEEILEVREELELSVISKAVSKATANDLDDLISICKKMDREIHVNEFLKWDLQFHKALAQSTHNRVFAALVHSFFEMTEDYPFLMTKYTSNFLDILSKAQKQHWQMIEAIKAKDPEQAMKVMTEHMELFKEEVEFIKNKTPNLREAHQ